MAGRLTSLPPRVATVDARIAAPPPKTADRIYLTPEWRALVAQLIRERGHRCEGKKAGGVPCGRSYGDDGRPVRLFGDHVVELKDGGAALDPANVQLLCGSCHTAKTARARAARQARVFPPRS